MKILYGIQGTGNGHLTRARALVPALRKAGIEMDFIFSGRSRKDYFNMEVFGNNYRCFSGLSLTTSYGKLDTFKTIRNAQFSRFVKDVINLNLDDYDLIISDFEPITAWAAKLRNKPSMGISHQCAFKHNIPKVDGYISARILMNIFAPTKINIGLHWHHFDQPILPPLVEEHKKSDVTPNKIVVYMPFEELSEVLNFVKNFSNFEFIIYTNKPYPKKIQHITIKRISKEFHHDLETAEGVICNAGFELGSECILLGKKMLVKPLLGQFEQLSNALALAEMGRATVIESLDQRVLDYWLDMPGFSPINYSNVADKIASWISKGNFTSIDTLVDECWRGICDTSDGHHLLFKAITT